MVSLFSCTNPEQYTLINPWVKRAHSNVNCICRTAALFQDGWISSDSRFSWDRDVQHPWCFISKRQKNLSKSKHLPAMFLGLLWAPQHVLRQNWPLALQDGLFFQEPSPAFLSQPAPPAVSTALPDSACPFHLSSRQTLLQSVTRTSLQCHSTPTVIPEPALALNLVQIFKVAITSYTSLLPRGDKLQIYTIPYQYFLKVIYCFASNSYCFFDCRRADFSDDHCNGVCAAPSFPTH